MITQYDRYWKRVVQRSCRKQSVYAALLVLWGVAAIGCERLSKKWDARERRMNYLQHRIDSARTAHDAHNDSLRHAGQGSTNGR